MTSSITLLRGFIVSADERIQPSIDTDTLPHLLRRAGIDFFEIVRTNILHTHDESVMFVDDDGHQRGLRPNRRAQFLSGYPLEHPIVGDVLFLREVMSYEGADTATLTDLALTRYFTSSATAEDYGQWLDTPLVREYSERLGFITSKMPLSFNG